MRLKERSDREVEEKKTEMNRSGRERMIEAKERGNKKMSGLKGVVKELVTCYKEQIRGI